MPTLVSLHQPSELKVSCRPPNAFQPSAYDKLTLAFLPGSCYILAHVQMLRYLLTLLLYYIQYILYCNPWRNYGATGPAAAGPSKKGFKMAHFSSHIGRHGELGAHFLDPAGGPKFEVTPLTAILYTLYSVHTWTASLHNAKFTFFATVFFALVVQ